MKNVKEKIFGALFLIQFVYISHIERDRNYWRTEAKKELETSMHNYSEQENRIIDLEGANYDLTQKAKYNLEETQYVIDRGQALIKRLLTTTDITYTLVLCNDNQISIKKCFADWNKTLNYLDQNRKANF